MIDPRYIMLGNLLNLEGLQQKVTSIDLDRIEDNFNINGYYDLSKWDYIPITQESILLIDPKGEIIKKYLWEENEFNIDVYNSDWLTIDIKSNLVVLCLYKEQKDLPHIQYIHQLQNLYHSLT